MKILLVKLKDTLILLASQIEEEIILLNGKELKRMLNPQLITPLVIWVCPIPSKPASNLKKEIGDKQTIAQKATRAEELERALNRQSVEAVIGEEGQKITKDSIEDTEEVATKSKESAQKTDLLAQEAQNAESSQDVY